MSQQVNFKLKSVINSTVDTRLKNNNGSGGTSSGSGNHESLSSFYEKRKNDSAHVGRNTTYDVVGKRDYKTLFDERKYKF
jgi:hypothetical protein